MCLDLCAPKSVGEADGASNCLTPARSDSSFSSESLKCASYIQTHATINLIFRKKKSLSDKMLQLSLSE